MSLSKNVLKHQQIIHFESNVEPNVSKIVSDDIILIPTLTPINQYTDGVSQTEVFDYSCVARFYSGQSFAIHTACSYIAYVVENGVRDVVKVGNYSISYLNTTILMALKNESVKDMAFAQKTNPILVAFITSKSYVYIYEIIKANEHGMNFDGVLYASLLLDPCTTVSTTLSWCNFIPKDVDSEFDFSECIVITSGEWAELWNIKKIHEKFPKKMCTRTTCEDHIFIGSSNDELILHGGLSPDGTICYLIYTNGYIRFYRVNLKTNEKIDLKQDWVPHGKKVVTMLYFLDNEENLTETFWNFAVTGAKHNAEIKIWNCSDWTSIQKLRFKRDSKLDTKFQSVLDSTAKYLLLYDKIWKLMYVLHIDQAASRASILYITEFYTASDIFNFGITSIFSFSDDIPSEYQINIIVIYIDRIQHTSLDYSLSECTEITNDSAGSSTIYRKPDLLRKEHQVVSALITTNLNTNVFSELQENYINDESSVEDDDVEETEEENESNVEDDVDETEEEIESSVEDDMEETEEEMESSVEDDMEEAEEEIETSAELETTDNIDNSQNSTIIDEDNSFEDEQQILLQEKINKLTEDMKEMEATVMKDAESISLIQNSLLFKFDEISEHMKKNEQTIRNICDENVKQFSAALNAEMKMITDEVLESRKIPVDLDIVTELNKIHEQLDSKLNDGISTMMKVVNNRLEVFYKELLENISSTVLPSMTNSVENIYTNLRNNAIQSASDTMTSIFKEHTDAVIQNSADVKVVEDKINLINDKIEDLGESVGRIQPIIKDTMKTAVNTQSTFIDGYFYQFCNRLSSLERERFHENLSRLITFERIDEAFQKVLTVRDQISLIFLCEKLDADILFVDRSRLSHEMILGLINQLTVDLPTKTELRLKFLEKAIAFLATSRADKNKETFSKVITFAIEKLSEFVTTLPMDYKYRPLISLLIADLWKLQTMP